MRKIDDTWMTFTEGMAKKYPGFCLDKEKIFLYNKTAVEIDLNEMKALFASKDIGRYEEIKSKWFDGTSLFVKPNKENNVVTYCTYPRSGNSMMRKHFENLTGIATGSDQVMKFSLNVALQYSGFKAEGIVDERVWINKSHFPFRIPFDMSY